MYCLQIRLESTRWQTPHLDNSSVTNSSVTNKGPSYTVYGNALSVSDTVHDLGVIKRLCALCTTTEI